MLCVGSRATLLLASTLAAAEPPPASDLDPPADAVLANVPFEEAPPHRIRIDLAPPENARRLPLELDTGATASAMSPRLARSLGVKVSRTKSTPYRRATRLGRDVLFYVVTRRSDTAATGGGFEFGLLGGDFLSDYVVELDFEGRRVRFIDPDRFEVPAAPDAEGEAVLPLEIVSNRLAVVASVNGTPLPLLVDTGAPFGLMLSGELAAASGVDSAPVPGVQLRTTLGPFATEVGEVARIELGPFGFTGVAAVVAPNGLYNLGFPGDSILGIDLLSQFLVRIDYPRRRLWLRRNPRAQLAFDPRSPQSLADMAAIIPPEPPDALEALAPRSAPEPQQVWLEWGRPEDGARVAGPVGWVEVRGWAGVGNPVQHDVAIVVDVSGSTAIASGTDVDGDGKLGRKRRHIEAWRTFNPRHYSSDPGDTVLAAELLATRRLVELLDPDRTRIGLVAFSGGARILAPLGSEPARIDGVLTDLEEAFGSGATNLAAAIGRAAEVLLAGDASGAERQKHLLILSDGWPTAPGSAVLAAQSALEAAQEAADAGIRIHTFALGLGDIGEDDVYAKVAALTGGHYRRLDEPGAIVNELPRVDLAEVAAVEIENATSGTEGRAVRVRPDGSFDGFLLLAPGENRVRVTARGDAGGVRTDERRVRFEARAPRDAEESAAFQRRMAELRATLERRRIETELVAEIEAARRQTRELEVEGEASPAPEDEAQGDLP